MIKVPDFCPKCNVDFKDKPIPEKHREFYGNETHFSRLIFIYDRDLDRTVSWRCPDCGYTWKRENEKE
jgi:rubrerythrin